MNTIKIKIPITDFIPKKMINCNTLKTNSFTKLIKV